MAEQRNAMVQDHVALFEIDLTAELMIAAAAAEEERLSAARIDELLEVSVDRGERRRCENPRARAEPDQARRGCAVQGPNQQHRGAAQGLSFGSC
ncbi:hypothetical protein ACFV3R_33205 [Streptomyces sp. NPDC059740]|uniref:hypothetical protein n=1 Tax=Streptomyces sp. NPDC059740 TaxID=3346926 RepID=UPI0036659BFA